MKNKNAAITISLEEYEKLIVKCSKLEKENRSLKKDKKEAIEYIKGWGIEENLVYNDELEFALKHLLNILQGDNEE